MARKRPDPAKTPAALKAVVLTYEKELRLFKREANGFAALSQKLKSIPEAGNREPVSVTLSVQFFQMLSRRLDLMDKYEAALREYVEALERQVADLEKKSGESWKAGIEP
jgi:hypothetical protein